MSTVHLECNLNTQNKAFEPLPWQALARPLESKCLCLGGLWVRRSIRDCAWTWLATKLDRRRDTSSRTCCACLRRCPWERSCMFPLCRQWGLVGLSAVFFIIIVVKYYIIHLSSLSTSTFSTINFIMFTNKFNCVITLRHIWIFSAILIDKFFFLE